MLSRSAACSDVNSTLRAGAGWAPPSTTPESAAIAPLVTSRREKLMDIGNQLEGMRR